MSIPISLHIAPARAGHIICRAVCGRLARSGRSDIRMPRGFGSYMIRNSRRTSYPSAANGRAASVALEKRTSTRGGPRPQRAVTVRSKCLRTTTPSAAHSLTRPRIFQRTCVFLRRPGTGGSPCEIVFDAPPGTRPRMGLVTSMAPARIDKQAYGVYEQRATMSDRPFRLKWGRHDRDISCVGVPHTIAISGRHDADMPGS